MVNGNGSNQRQTKTYERKAKTALAVSDS
ncbi:MAG: hypothetical protein ACI8SE_000052, partial [Bacteroidia bacterium]